MGEHYAKSAQPVNPSAVSAASRRTGRRDSRACSGSSVCSSAGHARSSSISPQRGGVTGVVNADRGRKIIEARPIALLVLAARGDGGDVELVRTARLRGVPTILVALSKEGPASLVVDGQEVMGVSNGALMATVQATIGGPIDACPTDPSPRAT